MPEMLDGAYPRGAKAPINLVKKAIDDLKYQHRSVGCKVYQSASQSIPNNTSTYLQFNSEYWDTESIHNNVTNNTRLTCRTAGKYLVVGQCVFEANAAGVRQVVVQQNRGDIPAGNSILPSAGGGTPTIVVVSTIFNLAIGDYVEMLTYQNSGGALDAQADTLLMMQKIG